MGTATIRASADQRAVRRVFRALLVLATWALVAGTNAFAGTFAPAASMVTGRYYHSSTTLKNGKVLVAGGNRAIPTAPFFQFLESVELYDPATNTWSPAGTLSPPLAYHVAVLLPNGKVLIIGGCEPTAPAPPQLYDPATNDWVYAGRTIPPTRLFPTATLLPDGRVLVAGGLASSRGGPVLKSAQLFDPDTNTWTEVPDMSHARVDHTATLLPNGTVLIAGGRRELSHNANRSRIADAEIYDPATNTWSSGGTLVQARDLHTATLLLDGTVLVTGGEGPMPSSFFGTFDVELRSAEIYDPVLNRWSLTSSSTECQKRTEDLEDEILPGCMADTRKSHAAIRLPNGNVLVTGGIGLKTAEEYVPAARQFVATGDMTSVRELHSATLLPNGKPLFVGGWNQFGGPNATLRSAEIYTGVAATVPGPPVIGAARAGNAQAWVKFSPPSSDGGSPVTGYTITSIPPGGIDANAGSQAFEHVVSNLTNGVSYRFTVKATNAVGTGAPSAMSNAVTPGPDASTICAGFNDVAALDNLCRNVQWLRNRAVTLGCTGTTFCPGQPVQRLQMAAFMNRLGTALTPVVLEMAETPGAWTPGFTLVNCQSADHTPAGRPAHAKVTAVLMAKGASTLDIHVDVVQSANGGTAWSSLGGGTKSTLTSSGWTGVKVIGSGALASGQPYRFGLRVLQPAGARVDLSDSRCLVRVVIDNRDGGSMPFDAE